jgi:hypothetical protein
MGDWETARLQDWETGRLGDWEKRRKNKDNSYIR